jgi:hypothetical protein
MFRRKLCTVFYLDQAESQREEKVRCRITPWSIYIGTSFNEFIPMHRVYRIFVHK